MDELKQLKTENDVLRDLLNRANAEKIAIDQFCMSVIKDNFALRTQMILAEDVFKNKNNEIQELKEKLTTTLDIGIEC